MVTLLGTSYFLLNRVPSATYPLVSLVPRNTLLNGAKQGRPLYTLNVPLNRCRTIPQSPSTKQLGTSERATRAPSPASRPIKARAKKLANTGQIILTPPLISYLATRPRVNGRHPRNTLFITFIPGKLTNPSRVANPDAVKVRHPLSLLTCPCLTVLVLTRRKRPCSPLILVWPLACETAVQQSPVT